MITCWEPFPEVQPMLLSKHKLQLLKNERNNVWMRRSKCRICFGSPGMILIIMVSTPPLPQLYMANVIDIMFFQEPIPLCISTPMNAHDLNTILVKRHIFQPFFQDHSLLLSMLAHDSGSTIDCRPLRPSWSQLTCSLALLMTLHAAILDHVSLPPKIVGASSVVFQNSKWVFPLF